MHENERVYIVPVGRVFRASERHTLVASLSLQATPGGPEVTLQHGGEEVITFRDVVRWIPGSERTAFTALRSLSSTHTGRSLVGYPTTSDG